MGGKDDATAPTAPQPEVEVQVHETGADDGAEDIGPDLEPEAVLEPELDAPRLELGTEPGPKPEPEPEPMVPKAKAKELQKAAKAAQVAAKKAGVLAQEKRGKKKVPVHPAAAALYAEGEASLKRKEWVKAQQSFAGAEAAVVADGARADEVSTESTGAPQPEPEAAVPSTARQSAPLKNPALLVEDEAQRVLAIVPNTSVEKESALRDVAQRGDVRSVLKLLDGGCAVDGVDASGGFTALLSASCHGHEEVVLELLRYHADVGGADERGLTPLHWAVAQRHVGVARVLLRRSGAAEVCLERRGGAAGLTPFLMAVKNGDWECMAVLVRAGCDVHARSRHDQDGRELAEAAAAGGEHRQLFERLALLQAELAASERAEVARRELRQQVVSVLLSYRHDEPTAMEVAGAVQRSLQARGYSVSEASKHTIERASVAATSSGSSGGRAAALEAAAAVRRCSAVVAIVSEGYAAPAPEAQLEPGQHAAAHAAATRVELACAKKHRLPTLVVVPMPAAGQASSAEAVGSGLAVPLLAQLRPSLQGFHTTGVSLDQLQEHLVPVLDELKRALAQSSDSAFDSDDVEAAERPGDALISTPPQPESEPADKELTAAGSLSVLEAVPEIEAAERRVVELLADNSKLNGAHLTPTAVLKHPELLLEQLRRHSRAVQRLTDRVYLQEQLSAQGERAQSEATEELRRLQVIAICSTTHALHSHYAWLAG